MIKKKKRGERREKLRDMLRFEVPMPVSIKIVAVLFGRRFL
jgi:hypothetical protein